MHKKEKWTRKERGDSRGLHSSVMRRIPKNEDESWKEEIFEEKEFIFPSPCKKERKRKESSFVSSG